MKILLLGTDYFSITVGEEIKNNIIAILTIADIRSGRGMKLTQTPLAKWAINEGIEVLKTDNIKSEEFANSIKKLEPDLFVVASFGLKIPEKLIDIPKFGGINVHPSLLPKYRGMAPVTRAIMNGEKITGVTIHILAKKIDAGDIIYQETVEISDLDDDSSLKMNLAKKGGKAVKILIDEIKNGTLKRKKQNSSEVTYAHSIKKRDRLIDWTKKTENIFNQIRALHPKPLAYTYFKNLNIEILEVLKGKDRSELAEKETNLSPGMVLKIKPLEIITLDGTIILNSVKPASRKTITGRDLVNGCRIKIGDRFG